MLRRVIIMCCAFIFAQSAYTMEAEEKPGNTHIIKLEAAKLDSGQLAYRMVSHRIRNSAGLVKDITEQYSSEPTIPGPAIVMTEGDV
ncbi:MAG: multicopper oxidase domain-containing protein, partial [Methylosarcina sp.]